MGFYRADQVYDRGQLHADARERGQAPGNRTAGIVRIGSEQTVFWNPFRRLYANRWIREPEEFQYSGEGSVGEMTETGGNRDLLQAQAGEVPVTVFYKLENTGSRWLCLGEYQVIDSYRGVSRDTTGTTRADIRFQLARTDSTAITTPVPHVAVSPPALPTEGELWDLANARQGTRRRGQITQRAKRQSDPFKSLYAVLRAILNGGACELCQQAPGWVGEDGRPHFQVHHIDPELDYLDWIAALCGTCHDRMHHGNDRQEQTAILRDAIRSRQLSAGRPIFEPAWSP